MRLWKNWLLLVSQLRDACTRKQTFMWLIVCLAGMSIRIDNLGITSIIRSMGLIPNYYRPLLHLMNYSSLCVDKLTRLWTSLALKNHNALCRKNGRIILVGDGIKIPKSGKKMPGVKKLCQQSESNTKREYIMGHSCQVISILGKAMSTIFAIPLIGRIHEGVIFSNRDKRTLLDKMIIALDSLNISQPFYFVADAYYASGKIVGMLLKRNAHLITRAKTNAVAYEKCTTKRPGRGRPKKYGTKVRLSEIFSDLSSFT